MASTEEPTLEPQIIDVATDPNATLRTPLPTSTPRALPVGNPTPAPVPTSPAPSMSESVDHVTAALFEPLFAGGRIGLAASAIAGLAALGMHLFRRKR